MAPRPARVAQRGQGEYHGSMSASVTGRNRFFPAAVFLVSLAGITGLTAPLQAGDLPELAAASGWQASVRPSAGGSLEVTFHPAEWPGVHWKAAPGTSWNWSGKALVVTLENTGTTPLEPGLRVDDDPAADGQVHCRTVICPLEPGQVRTLTFLPDPVDPMQKGMRGGPPDTREDPPARGSLRANHIVAVQVFLHAPGADRTLRIRSWALEPRDQAALWRGIADSFGQFTRSDWPGKIHGDADWALRRAAEASDLAAHPAPADRDKWGGWAAGPLLEATGHFRTARWQDRWWLVTPEGHLFLSFGVDVASPFAPTLVGPRRDIFGTIPWPDASWGRVDSTLYGPWKQGSTYDFFLANQKRKWGPDALSSWGLRTRERLLSWGFNTIGNWSDSRATDTGGRPEQLPVPYTAGTGVWGTFGRIRTGDDYWAPMPDPFDPAFARAARQSLKEMAPRDADPWCIGVFVDNELSWTGPGSEGDLGLGTGTLAAPAGSKAKGALKALLQERYPAPRDLGLAWGINLSGWDALDRPLTLPSLNDASRADLREFVVRYARQYTRIVKTALKEACPRLLYLGCRFSGTPPEWLVAAAAEDCDVVSFNIYRHALDPAVWGYTAGLGKPCLVGEFHFGARDRGMFHPGLVEVPDQRARGEAFAAYVASVRALPAFVGAHWFQYADEPLTGRTLDGENYQIGLVSVTDDPYPELIAAVRAALSGIYPR